ncbi:hypothetical protein E4U35_000354 [Claviceps purpurea]|nr:hypothetical protein E4U51_008709 [Claviceps purpurea]KAG6165333.1 hypothetical protein E4U27_008419 [Claviceps purpurea]KAG6194826.1 hypothetical protein E4U35_000354 [Claviceps purpurea]KAG6216538.1 hypothetical protein E4U26_008113 [Claviceps purpurea]KAG6219313.1 hypothetical protein E4U34_003678 [Claviceps purpurea]
MDGSIPSVSYPFAIQSIEKESRMINGPLPDSALPGSCTDSHTTSITSSFADNSPNTTPGGDVEQSNRRKYGYNPIPKLDRTMTDVYGDELYNPNFAITSTSPTQARPATSTGSDVFSQRINAANFQHLSAVQSPGSSGSGARSPFRRSSPFSTPPCRGVVSPHFPTSQRWSQKEQNSQPQVVHADSTAEPETPKTISPKDAVLEFNEAEPEWALPLFPQNSSNDMEALTKSVLAQKPDATYCLQKTSSSRSHGLGHLPSRTELRSPQQHKFNYTGCGDSPPRLSSSGASSIASGRNTPTDCDRPTNIGADSGTYTCTYHGCTLRFDTPTMLQKHKREGHRQPQGLFASRLHEPRPTPSILNSQAGPHRCDRINPSTGKSCNAEFSRPYDLTRHEDTIHNARKQKVRCNLCTEDKTFSRADALTRHYRVCHPDMELAGKPRRKGGA